MALTKAFYEAVNTGDVCMVRIMMKDSLLVDPSFAEFREMEKEASKIQGLYEQHDGRSFELDKSAWNDDYMSKQRVELISNFSHERLDHLKEVIRYLRPVTETSNKNPSIEEKIHKSEHSRHSSEEKITQRNNYQEQKRRDQEEGRYRGTKVASGAIMGAVAGGAVAALAGATVVGGAVAGAAVGGLVVYASTTEGK